MNKVLQFFQIIITPSSLVQIFAGHGGILDA